MSTTITDSVAWATSAVMVAASSVVIGKPQTRVDVWGDPDLFALSLIGAVLGGLISVLMLPQVSENPLHALKIVTTKMLLCILTGIALAPAALRYAEVAGLVDWGASESIPVDIIVGVSALMAIFGVSLIYWGFSFINGKSKPPTKPKR